MNWKKELCLSFVLLICFLHCLYAEDSSTSASTASSDATSSSSTTPLTNIKSTVETKLCTTAKLKTILKNFLDDKDGILTEFKNRDAVLTDEFFTCEDKNHEFMFLYDPCITREITRNNKTEKIYISFLNGKGVSSSVPLPFNNLGVLSKRLQNLTAINVKYDFFTSGSLDFISFRVYNSSVNKVYLQAVFPKTVSSKNCTFIGRLGSKGKTQLIVTVVVAPIVILGMLGLYALFCQYILKNEAIILKEKQEVAEATTSEQKKDKNSDNQRNERNSNPVMYIPAASPTYDLEE